MKKSIKITLIVCGALFVLFLLLPFLVPSSPKIASQNGSAKAEPQIFTSNPLTELVSRIARFFRKSQNSERLQTPANRMTAGQADEIFGKPQGDTLYASAKNADGSSNTGTFSGDGAAYADAYLQTEEGDWVLIRQTAPEGSTRGMHEINVKDNAYNRLVAQERHARFTPVMRQPGVTEEVPDSRLARLFNPIKRLFGFGETPVAKGALQGTGDSYLASARTSSSAGIGKNTEKSSNLSKPLPIDWDGFRNNPFSSLKPGSTEATKRFADMIMPDAELKNMAEWLADIKYPNADNDPQAQQEKQDFIRQWMQEKYQQVNEQSGVMLEEKAQEEINTLSDIIMSCENKISSVPATSCGVQPGTEELAAPTPEPEPIEEYKKSNAEHFYEKTQLHLPPAGITVVLHKTDQELPTEESLMAADIEEGYEPQTLSPEQRQALNMYHYMQEHCEGNCYWVATGKGPAQEMKQTVEAAGLVMKGDPLNRHEQYVEAFLAEQRSQGKTEEELQEMKEALNTPYTAYTQEDLQNLHRQTLDLLLDRAKPEDASVPFFTQSGSALQYYNETGRKHPMFYGEGNSTNGASLQQRSEALTDEVADFVNAWRPIIQEIKQEAAQEGVTDLSAPKIQEILKRTRQDIKNFNKNNDLGTYQK